MKLTVLVDNAAGGKLKAEHGLSYLIEHHGGTILLDAGYSGLFLDNAKQLGIDLQEVVDTVVLSHGHWDHGNGLVHFGNKTLLTHPKAFIKRYRKQDNSNIGLSYSLEDLSQKYDVKLNSKPFLIDEGVLFLGEVPRLNDFESQTTPFVDEHGEPDFIPDDSAIAIMEHGALNIVAGCSHAGICNIIDYAKKVMHCDKVNTVIGGFHLKHDNMQTQKTIAYFQENKVKYIYPSHCTDLPAMAAFYKAFTISQLKVGNQINV